MRNASYRHLGETAQVGSLGLQPHLRRTLHRLTALLPAFHIAATPPVWPQQGASRSHHLLVV